MKKSKESRNGRFTRVSNKVYHQLNARVVLMCDDVISRHPSKGITLTQVL